MLRDTINHGETYDLSISGEDENGDPVEFSDDIDVALRVCRLRTNGELLVDVPLQVVSGVVRADIDTGDAPWEDGVFVYDLRFTDDLGNDVWTEPVQLVLDERCSPPS
ncbi:MAG: hypothetical protein ACPHCN_11870 [Mycobacterium sp.]